MKLFEEDHPRDNGIFWRVMYRSTCPLHRASRITVSLYGSDLQSASAPRMIIELGRQKL